MKLRKIIHSKPAMGSVITLCSLIIAYIISTIPVIGDLQYKSMNTLFNFRGPITPADTSIIIIAIDDQSLTSLPSKYPYPTSFYAKMIDNLVEAGVRLIVFDVEFTEENTANPEFDIRLARSVTDARNVVLAGKIVDELGRHNTRNSYLVPPIAPLLRSMAKWGIVNVIEDDDGFIRRYLLFHLVEDRPYYPLALHALAKLENLELPTTLDQTSKTFRIGRHIISKVNQNTMYINFRGPAKTFNTYSLSSVLDDSTFTLRGDEDTDVFESHKEWGTFRNKIAFVGATAEELQDNKFTPFYNYQGLKQKMPGMEMHANALSTLMHDDFLKPIDPFVQLLLTLFMAGFAAAITLILKPVKALVIAALQIGLVAWIIYLLFSNLRLVTFTPIPVSGILFSFVITNVYQIVLEQREKNRIRKTFQQYVSPAIVEKMLSTGEMPSYGGERRTLTILFSDIRKFTTFSETHEPEFVVHRLSEYLTGMVDVIFKYNGTLDKFVGDEIMALFGAPYYFEDHAERACQTALEMQTKLKEMQKKWRGDKNSIFDIGIGINTGKVIVGNLGSNQLFDYTVIGDQVNIGARLEGANKEYQTTIILSESTYELVKKRAKARELDYVRVMGKTKPIRIYELFGMDKIPQMEQDYLIDVFYDGLTAFRERRWADALKIFRRVLRYFPQDGPSKIYTIRCLNNIENPPPVEWDGVYEFKTK
jgi:adenylate cyclase